MPVLDFFLNDISPVTKNLRFDVGATLPVLRVRVMDGNDPVSLAGGTAVFNMKDKDGNSKILNATAIIEGDGTSGIVRYEWTASDTDVARIYFAQFTITLAGEDLIVPNDADQVLRVIMGKADFQRGTVIQQPVAQGIQVVALGGTPTLDAIGRWFKVVVSALDFTAAAVEESIDLFQLPPGGIVEAIKAKHSVAFAGGAITAYTVEVGSAALTQKYMSAFDVFSAPSPTNHKVATSGDEESHTVATPIKVTGKSTGGDVVDATAGTVEIWIKASTVLASGGLLFSDGFEVQDDDAAVVGGPFSIINFKGFKLVVDEGGGIVGVTSPPLAVRKILTSGFGLTNNSGLFFVTGLDLAIPSAGEYLVKWYLFIDQVGAVAGIKLQTFFSGTAISSRLALSDFGKDNKTFNESGVNSANGTLGTLFTIAQAAAGKYLVVIEGGVRTAGSGTLRLLMGQSVADGGTTSIQTESFAEAKKV